PTKPIANKFAPTGRCFMNSNVSYVVSGRIHRKQDPAGSQRRSELVREEPPTKPIANKFTPTGWCFLNSGV
ncbi:MAG: hypothetical protein ABW185_05745, partial [Sedimenticola sp.]